MPAPYASNWILSELRKNPQTAFELKQRVGESPLPISPSSIPSLITRLMKSGKIMVACHDYGITKLRRVYEIKPSSRDH